MASRIASSARRMCTSAGVAKHITENAQSSAKHQASTGTWKSISLMVALPVTMALAYKAFFVAEHPHPQEFTAYQHLRLRKKSYPWGDGNHTLFHTDEANALPDGWVEGHGPGHAH
eukprot:m.9459 g.9459  ORF g.9459 m.9459 type:complete len:116 (-) comp6917_c0_seq1:174-521(-)